MTKFDIEIVTDSVCPWCYVGKTKLDKATEAYKEVHPNSEDTFSMTWMPFYLEPGAPQTGVDRIGYYRAKSGRERTDMMFKRLSQIGREVGINSEHGGKTGNTRDSHRLVQLGESTSPALQTRVSGHDVLLGAAVKAGLDESEARDWLQSDRGGPEADGEVEQARLKQISGVPNFTVQAKYEIGGVQDPAVFLRLFEKIKAQEEGAEA
ncbi:uncharacterized protein L3040_004307 [Drepanopeziza brunnea f. sp. 'multigermtubi']|uniref:uncharacterized protein n=1 Tax=Drepanopeziza brunnea f. sp. 'multigermtubi' TaxID=698441 RepID=UPI0023A09DBD|nr:hypothetical protein L3040_004307 [Drepanopeziza brunnea f. sp. 'multigermtubi']